MRARARVPGAGGRFYAAFVAAAGLFSAAGGAGRERMDAKARVQRAYSTRGAARG